MTTDATPALADDPTATVAQRLIAVQRDLPAIGKNQQNTAPGQNYSFRGIDDTINALNPLLAKHGVIVLPSAGEMRTEQRMSKSGGTTYCSYVHMTYTWLGIAGDTIITSFWGEGTDSLDKSTNKAAQAAYKYMLFQALSICTKELVDNDSDKDGGDESLPAWMTSFVKRFNAYPEDIRIKMVARIAKRGEFPEGWQLDWGKITHPSWERTLGAIFDAADAALAKAAQDEDAERGDTPAPEPENQDPPENVTPDPTSASDETDVSTEAEPTPPESAPDRSAPVAVEPQAEPTPPPAPEPDPEPEPAEAAPTAPPVVPDGVPEDATQEQIDQYQAVVDWLADPSTKGPALQTALRDAGLPVAGKIGELKERILEASFRTIFFPPLDIEEEDEIEHDGSAEDTADVIPFSPKPPAVEDEYTPFEGQQATVQQSNMLAEAIAEINDEKVFDAWVRWRSERGLDDDYAKWSMANALRAMGFLEEHGL